MHVCAAQGRLRRRVESDPALPASVAAHAGGAAPDPPGSSLSGVSRVARPARAPRASGEGMQVEIPVQPAIHVVRGQKIKRRNETANVDLLYYTHFIVRLLSFDRCECGPNASFSYVVVTGPRGNEALSSERRTTCMRVKKLERELTALPIGCPCRPRLHSPPTAPSVRRRWTPAPPAPRHRRGRGRATEPRPGRATWPASLSASKTVELVVRPAYSTGSPATASEPSSWSTTWGCMAEPGQGHRGGSGPVAPPPASPERPRRRRARPGAASPSSFTSQVLCENCGKRSSFVYIGSGTVHQQKKQLVAASR